MLSKARARSAPTGSSRIAARIARAPTTVASGALGSATDTKRRSHEVSSISRLTHVNTVFTTAKTELLASGRKRSFAASAAGLKASSFHVFQYSRANHSTAKHASGGTKNDREHRVSPPTRPMSSDQPLNHAFVQYAPAPAPQSLRTTFASR